MAENIDDGESWLPSEFLPDDFLLDRRPFPCEFGSDLSFMSQPVTETDGDDENYITSLTLQMAHSFLHENDDESSLLARDYPEMQAMAGSPQSTLSRVGSWSGSNKGSPSGASQVSSPPSTPFSQQTSDDARDLLSSHPVPVPSKNPITQTKPLVNQQQQMQAERFYQLKQQQLIQQQLSAAWERQQSTSSGKGGGGYEQGIRCGRSSAWPTPQRQHRYPQSGSGMRAVFLTGSDTSAGTGVFLPRTPGNPTGLRKKPTGTTVLLPDRVIQALNLNLDEMGVHQRLYNHTGQRKRNYHRPPPTSALADTELRLPDEWTY